MGFLNRNNAVHIERLVAQKIEIDNIHIGSLVDMAPHPNKKFAYSASISGDWVLVGACGAIASNVSESGVAYLYRNTESGLQLFQTLTPTTGQRNLQFGFSVSIDGDVAIVGARGDSSITRNGGSVYVYHYTQEVWQLKDIIRAGDGASNDFFGGVVAINGERILVGASRHGVAGAAYLFEFDTETERYTQTCKFQPEDLTPNALFASSIALNKDNLIVGAYGGNKNGIYSGCVYSYRLVAGTWQMQILYPDKSAEFDYFGAALSLHDNTLLISAYGHDGVGKNTGVVHVFSLVEGSWEQTDSFEPVNTKSGACFGRQLDFDGKHALIASPNQEGGTYYVYKNEPTGWVEVAKFDRLMPDSGLGVTAVLQDNKVFLGFQGNGFSGLAYLLTFQDSINVAESISHNHQSIDVISEKLVETKQAISNLDQSLDNVSKEFFSTWVTQCKISPDDRTVGDEFGNVVALGDNTLAIAAVGINGGSGAVYVYSLQGNNWQQQAKIQLDDAKMFDEFGSSIALFENTLVIGAPGRAIDTNVKGTVYVYVCDGNSWNLQETLIANDMNGVSDFGHCVALYGETLVVGAPSTDSMGAAYVFVREGQHWRQSIKLQPSNSGDKFGYSVALDENTMVIAAPHADSQLETQTGAVYVYGRANNEWFEHSVIQAHDAHSQDKFGSTVAIDSDIIAVGALRSTAGAVYVFGKEGEGWFEQAKLQAHAGQHNNYFGNALSLEQNTLVVGAVYSQGNGAAYVYKRFGADWSMRQKLRSPAANNKKRFAYSIALCGDTLVVGEQLDYNEDSDVHVFNCISSNLN